MCSSPGWSRIRVDGADAIAVRSEVIPVGDGSIVSTPGVRTEPGPEYKETIDHQPRSLPQRRVAGRVVRESAMNTTDQAPNDFVCRLVATLAVEVFTKAIAGEACTSTAVPYEAAVALSQSGKGGTGGTRHAHAAGLRQRSDPMIDGRR